MLGPPGPIWQPRFSVMDWPMSPVANTAPVVISTKGFPPLSWFAINSGFTFFKVIGIKFPVVVCELEGLYASAGSCHACGGTPPDASKEDRQTSSLEGYGDLGIAGYGYARQLKQKLGVPTKTGAAPATLFCARIPLIPVSRHVLSQSL